ncbi:hypothetical protein PFISCL1PPCAC_1818, partial [Pristionchus fissidentatus]
AYQTSSILLLQFLLLLTQLTSTLSWERDGREGERSSIYCSSLPLLLLTLNDGRATICPSNCYSSPSSLCMISKRTKTDGGDLVPPNEIPLLLHYFFSRGGRKWAGAIFLLAIRPPSSSARRARVSARSVNYQL